MSNAEPRQDLVLDEALIGQAVALRRQLHSRPELSNEERETQRILRDALAAEGLVSRDVAGYGLAVDITGTGAPSNRKVVIRADIDALPIEEDTGLPFTSQTPGVMHACGHDVHAAMGFATAALLHRQRDAFGGTVRLIFQPAEEAEPLGGRRVVEEGLLDDVDAAIGIHVDPYAPTGTVSVGAGPYTLASDIFDITVTGVSAHAAKPSDGVDAIAVACAMVGEVQKLVSRERDPFDPLVISVTGIQGGGAYNVIAPEVTLRGTIRSGREETRQRAWRRLREMLEGIAAAHGAGVTIQFVRGEPPVVNDIGMTEIVRQAATGLFGAGQVVNAPGWPAADDFGYYSDKRPSVYFRLGIRNEELGSVWPLHHPKFRVDEAAMPVGILTLATAARDFLAGAD